MDEHRSFLSVIKNVVVVILKLYVGLFALAALWNGSGGIIFVLMIAVASASTEFDGAMNFMSGPMMTNVFLILKLGISIYGSRLTWIVLRKKYKTTRTERWVLAFLLLGCSIGWALSTGLRTTVF